MTDILMSTTPELEYLIAEFISHKKQEKKQAEKQRGKYK